MSDILHPKKTHWCLYIFLAVVAFFVIATFLLYRFLQSTTPEQIFQNVFVQEQIKKFIPSEDQELFELLPTFLGFTEPRTYLILFLNNTELRPGGGFIGSYATVRVANGEVEVLKIEGTELLDRQAPESFRPVPPAIMAKELVVDRWYFRDSNWSPDFAVGAAQALELYRGEGGVAVDEIDGVIGITTEVLVRLLRITGPVEVNGIAFTPENAVQTLEYEVEYGFAEKQIHKDDRKDIIGTFFFALLDRVKSDVFQRPGVYLDTFAELTAEKHILAFAVDPGLEDLIDRHDWSGQMEREHGDYLLWVDANLAALKTDAVMKRHLTYGVRRGEGTYQASAKMDYQHTGTFDKFTTRYRTYARLFVPPGAVLKMVITDNGGGVKKILLPEQVDSGEELGKRWFGTFFVLEPGRKGSVEFVYDLPLALFTPVEEQPYSLLVQKQLGTLDHGLTLDLDFDKNILSATPGEVESEWGDRRYRVNTDLRLDREFFVSVE